MIQQRKKRNSSKVNLTISFIFHSLLLLAIFFFAAREGMLGKKLKEITVTMAPKEKKPEPPKPKPEEPKPEEPKVAQTPKNLAVPQPKLSPATAAPVVDAPPAVAPPSVTLPDFQFSDGAHAVETTSDPATVYKGLVEFALRSHWDRPANTDDDNFTAEVQVSVDPTGKLSGYQWLKGSGNNRWDESVKNALAATKSISRPPPKGFPDSFLVRFDVIQVAESENLSAMIR